MIRRHHLLRTLPPEDASDCYQLLSKWLTWSFQVIWHSASSIMKVLLTFSGQSVARYALILCLMCQSLLDLRICNHDGQENNRLVWMDVILALSVLEPDRAVSSIAWLMMLIEKSWINKHTRMQSDQPKWCRHPDIKARIWLPYHISYQPYQVV